jgi:hypothetical protein
MPGYDKTGPAGMGPGTGGRRGFCQPGTQMTDKRGPAPVYGVGRGGKPFGGGRGKAWGGGRRRNSDNINPSQEETSCGAKTKNEE